MRTNLTDAMMQAARDRLPALDRKLKRLHARRALLPEAERTAIDWEIKRAADEIASAYARSQNQLDCEPPEVAEWVDTPTAGAEPEVIDLRGGKTIEDHPRKRDRRVPRWPSDAA